MRVEIAGEHARELGARVVEQQRRAGPRPALPFGFDDRDVGVGEGRDLRKVRHTEHLVLTSQPGEGSTHCRPRFAADARVDLVEHQRRRRFRQHHTERQHRARELAAGRGLGEWPSRLARIGSEEEGDVVGAVVGHGALHRHLEHRLRQCEPAG